MAGAIGIHRDRDEVHNGFLFHLLRRSVFFSLSNISSVLFDVNGLELIE